MINFEATRIFFENFEAATRNVVNEGGTRSSKTYSIAQTFITRMREKNAQPLLFGIVRKTLPALKSSAMRDFFDILKSVDVYDESCHNKTENSYRIGNCLVEFFSLDDEKKVRGRKRDYLWINEANELSYDDFVQLDLRTTKQIFFDYNPSDMVHWIYTKITHDENGNVRPDCTLIKSTYLDNKFLDMTLITTIEKYRDDPEYWTVYGLGERAISKKLIYTNWDTVNELPEGGETIYGVDFGFNHPSACVCVRIHDGELYADEILYETKLTNTDLIVRLKPIITDMAYGDAAEPDRIEEFIRAGIRMQPCDKGKNSVKDGIDFLKRFKIHVTKSSTNLIKELGSYKWRVDKAGNMTDEPLDFNNDLVDAMRYAVVTHLKQNECKVLFAA